MAYEGFKAVEKKVGSPALAAWIGRKKYGKKKFQHAASSGHKMRHVAPLRKKRG